MVNYSVLAFHFNKLNTRGDSGSGMSSSPVLEQRAHAFD